MPDQNTHAAHVLAWLDAAAIGLGPVELLELLEHAISGIWRRANRTLGEVTLGAVLDRVIYDGVERFPALTGLVVGTEGVVFDGLRSRVAAQPPEEVRAAMETILVELLTLLGNLTGEILTPSLHRELAATRRPAGRAGVGRDDGEDRE